MSSSSALEVSASVTNGSRPLVINRFSMNPAVVPNAKVLARLRALEGVRGMKLIEKVERVTSVTANFIGIVLGQHGYEFDNKKTEKLTLLIMNPAMLYTGNEELFSDKIDKNGNVTEAELKINIDRKSLSIPISKSGTFDDYLKAWKAINPSLHDLDAFHEFKGPCAVDAKLDCPKPPTGFNIYEVVEVKMSAFKYLPAPDEVAQDAQAPTSVGLSIRIHTIKTGGEANFPLLFNTFAISPALMQQPTMSYEELKKVDIDVRNTKKGKVALVGSKILMIPAFCGVPALEATILETDKGTLATAAFQINGDKNPFCYVKQDKSTVMVADIVLTLNSWNGKDVWRDAISFRLWSENLRVYGCTEIGAWSLGMATSLMLQVPAIFTGQVMHTDSEALMRAKVDPSIRSSMSLQGMTPCVDLAGAVQMIGLPVSRHFAMEMALLKKRHGQGVASAHTNFTFAGPDSYTSNIYNNTEKPVLRVLNELDPAKRKAVFEDADANFTYFAVMGGYMITEEDHSILELGRQMAKDATYKGPLLEMLTSKKWKPSQTRDFEVETYGSGANEAPECSVPSTHPCVKNNIRTFAQASGQTVYWYLYAFSEKYYNESLTSKTSTNFLTIEPARKRTRSPEVDAATHATNGKAAKNNGAAFASKKQGGVDDDDDIIN